MRGLFVLAFSLIFLISAAFGATDEKSKVTTVLVQAAKVDALFEVLTYPARVIPKINAAVVSEIDGVVSKILAPLGQRVRRGQKMMVVQHTDPAYQYAPFSVTAPVNGIVSFVEVTEGSRVAKGQKLVSVTDPSKLRVLVEIASADLPSINAKLGGELKINGRSDVVPVKIHGVSPFVDPATGTASCELEIADSDIAKFNLPPGVVGQVTFKVNERKGISVADQAIVYKGKTALVRVVENGKSKSIPVTLGRRQRGYVEILSGLSEGMKVIERASGFLADGDTVAIETQ